MGKRLVLDEDMNRIIEENSKRAWEERYGQCTEPNEETENFSSQQRASGRTLVGSPGNVGRPGIGK